MLVLNNFSYNEITTDIITEIMLQIHFLYKFVEGITLIFKKRASLHNPYSDIR